MKYFIGPVRSIGVPVGAIVDVVWHGGNKGDYVVHMDDWGYVDFYSNNPHHPGVYVGTPDDAKVITYQGKEISTMDMQEAIKALQEQRKVAHDQMPFGNYLVATTHGVIFYYAGINQCRWVPDLSDLDRNRVWRIVE